jgi:Flp pilus assembly pilin Flp
MLLVDHRRGQGLPEYGLLIALVIVLVVGALGVVSGTVTGLYNNVASTVTGAVSSAPGSTPTGGGPGPTGGPGTPAVQLSVATPAAYQTITVSGSGFAPDSSVQAVLHPDPLTVLRVGSADHQGLVSLQVTIPADLNLSGAHYIALVGVAPTISGTPPALELDSASVAFLTNPLGVSASVGSSVLYSGNYGLATLALSSSVSGASGTVTYAWSESVSGFASGSANPAADLSCAHLPATVSLKVTDASGHNNTASVALAACPPPLTISASAGSPTFAGNYESLSLPVSATAAGGSGSLSYSWSGDHLVGASSAASADLSLTCSASSSSVSVTATDSAGQSESATVTVPACAAPIEAPIAASPLYSGNYSLVGVSLSAAPIGGQAPYTYAWTGPGSWSSSAATPAPSFTCSLSDTTVNLTITDSAGHAGTGSVTIAACPSPIVPSASAGSPTYNGNYVSQTRDLTGGATGGTGSYTYAWSGTGTFTTPTSQSPSLNLTCSPSATTETLTVTDAHLSTSTTVSIPACPSSVSATASITAGPLYSGNYSLAGYTLTGFGGQSDLTYTWTGPSGFTSSDQNPTYTFSCSNLPNDVSLTVADTHGNHDTKTVSLPTCTAAMRATTPTITGQTYDNNYTNTTIHLSSTVGGGVSPTYSWILSATGGTITWISSSTTTPTVTLPCADLVGGGQTITLHSVSEGMSFDSAARSLGACPGPLTFNGANLTTGAQSYNSDAGGNYVSTSFTNLGLSTAVSGGTTPYTYTWTVTDATGAGWSNPTSATPKLTVNCNGTTSTGSVGLSVSDARSATIVATTITLPACPGSMVASQPSITARSYDGTYTNTTLTLSATVSGGTTPVYTWSTSATGGTITWGGTNVAPTLTPTVLIPCADLVGGSQTLKVSSTSDGITSDSPTLTIPACPGYVSTFLSSFSGSNGITTDGTYLYTLTDYALYRIDPGTGAESVIAGAVGKSGSTTNVCGSAARFGNGPSGNGGITYDNGYLYVVDDTGSIRKIDLSTGCVSNISATGNIYSITADHAGHLWVSSGGLTERDLSGALVHSISTSGVGTIYGSGTIGPDGEIWFAGSSKIFHVNISTQVVTNVTATGVAYDFGVAVVYDATHGVFYISNRGSSRYQIRQMTPGGVLSVISNSAGTAGTADGTLLAAKYTLPYGIALIGGNLYIADNYGPSASIRKATSIYGP